jgi:hypothetical protein
MALNVCRFNPEHVFRNPVELRRHYELEHAHEWQPAPNPKVKCILDGCGKVLLRSNVYSHNDRAHHGASSVGSWVDIDQDTELTPRTYGTNGNGKVEAKETHPSSRINKRADINRCNVDGCEWLTKRGNMGKHFLRHHKELYHSWQDHVSKVEAPTAVVVANLPELATTTLEQPNRFAAHADGNGYTTDDFWLPVVHQLATPDGVVPVEAMAALGRFRDDVSRMLFDVTHLPPRKLRTR